jgi:hypothetical protein
MTKSLLLQFFLRTLPIVSDDVLKLSQPAVIVLFAPMLMHLLQYILSLSYEQNRICWCIITGALPSHMAHTIVHRAPVTYILILFRLVLNFCFIPRT